MLEAKEQILKDVKSRTKAIYTSSYIGIEVGVESDYSKFKLIEGNREVSSKYIVNLLKSFQIAYCVVPILVNEKFEVIDGQHRLHTFMDLGWGVLYFMVPGCGETEMIVMNTTLKKWRQKEFSDYFEAQGHEGHAVLNEIEDKSAIKTLRGVRNTLCLVTIRVLLSGRKDCREIRESVRTADFKIIEKELIYERFDKLQALRNIIFKRNRIFNSSDAWEEIVLDLIVNPPENFDYNHLLEQSDKPKLCAKYTDTRDRIEIKRIIKDIYTFGLGENSIHRKVKFLNDSDLA